MEQPAPAAMAIRAYSDDRAGNQRQASALAAALAGGDGRFDMVTLHPSLAARAFAPRCWPGLRQPFGAALTPGPALAIGCGRQAALATRLLRAQGSRAVQILDPRIAPSHWDLVIAPRHDHLAGDNVINLHGSMHPVDDTWLARARGGFAQFTQLPQPRTAVLLGGPSRHVAFRRDRLETLLEQLEAAQRRDGGSLLVTASRRTPLALREVLRARRAQSPGLCWLDAADGPNPYAGLLAYADRIVCSPDSVNMLSEACATRVPVFVADLDAARGRLREFLDVLLQQDRIRAMDALMAPFAVEPLRETARVAEEVRQRLNLPSTG